MTMKPPEFYQYTGVMHIHTTFSDGTWSPERIIALAQKCKLDFIAITDHMDMRAKKWEGWHNDLLVLVGYEIEDEKGINHFLAFGLKNILPEKLSVEKYSQRVFSVGGVGIIAHPVESRNFPKYPPLPWTKWDSDNFHGIEIWNHMSQWLEGLARGNKLYYLVNPRKLIVSPPSEILTRWDEISQRRKVAGIASADAHGFKIKILKIFPKTIFPYHIEMKSLRTHLVFRNPLPRDFQQAQVQVFNAIKDCNVFISNYRWGDATEFCAWLEFYDNVFPIGSCIGFDDNIKICAIAPIPAEFRVIRNGIEVYRTFSDKMELPIIQSGVYRIELWIKNKGWIFTNHFWIGKKL